MYLSNRVSVYDLERPLQIASVFQAITTTHRIIFDIWTTPQKLALFWSLCAWPAVVRDQADLLLSFYEMELSSRRANNQNENGFRVDAISSGTARARFIPVFIWDMSGYKRLIDTETYFPAVVKDERRTIGPRPTDRRRLQDFWRH